MRSTALCTLGLVALVGTAPLRAIVVTADSPLDRRDAAINVSVSELEELPSRDITSLDLTLPKSYVQQASVGVTPPGWGCETRKNTLSCSGAPIDAVYLSLHAPSGTKLPGSVQAEVMSGRERLFRGGVELTRSTAPTPLESLEGILSVPGRLTPGAFFFASPVERSYAAGTWRLHAGTGAAREPLDLITGVELVRPGGSATYGRNAFQIPETFSPGTQLSYTYTNPFGQILVDAPVGGYALTRPNPTCTPQIYACQRRISAKGSLCVCGCFPKPLDWLDLRIDGRPVGPPSAGAPYMFRFPLPDIEPGQHTLSWAPGSAGTGSLQFEAVRVDGSIDQGVILKGGSTGLEFHVDGSRSRIAMDISSRSTKISLQGGNVQRAITSGGSPNDIVRTLRGLEVGEYDIDFSVDIPECPCGVLENPPQELVRHPMELSGSTRLRVPGTQIEIPAEFSTENFIGYTPRPPLDARNIALEVAQLDLEARVPGLPAITFQTRSGLASGGGFTNVRLDDQGRFREGEISLQLHSDFSVPFAKELQLEPGLRIEYEMDGWSFSGRSPGIDSIRFEPVPEKTSRVVFDEIRTDRGKSTVFGNAEFELNGRLSFDGLQELEAADWARPDSATATTTLDQVIEQGWASVRIEGHADERGTREYNLALGERRSIGVELHLKQLLGSPFAVSIPRGTVLAPSDEAVSRLRIDQDVETVLRYGDNLVRVEGTPLDPDRTKAPSSSLDWVEEVPPVM